MVPALIGVPDPVQRAYVAGWEAAGTGEVCPHQPKLGQISNPMFRAWHMGQTLAGIAAAWPSIRRELEQQEREARA